MKTNYIDKLLSAYPAVSSCKADIISSINLLSDSIQSGNKILTCGNGGSAADAEHIVGELVKGFHLKRELLEEDFARMLELYPDDGQFLAENLQRAIPAISLVANISFLTAFINDMNPDFIFAQQVYALGTKEDVLIAISTSGNSPNIILAAKVAKLKGVKVISLTGDSGGDLKNHSDVTIKAPASEVAAIQELHLPIYHCICSVLEQDIFAS